MIGHEPFAKQLQRAAANAQAIIAQGTCAVYGGVAAAEGNPTGAITIPAFLQKEGINKPLINLPGCPTHPDWIVGTLAHVIKFGLPQMDAENRPTMFYSRLVHDQCPRFADYEREKFAKTFGDEGCLFKLGCMGPNTHADCTLRQWNGGTNTCIRAGAPCVGCAGKGFAAARAFPMYRKGA
jgi:hydrogenase small subunit